jgi:hypothetical protein
MIITMKAGDVKAGDALYIFIFNREVAENPKMKRASLLPLCLSRGHLQQSHHLELFSGIFRVGMLDPFRANGRIA